MNYKLHYNNLIERSKNRILKCYFEKHHILPKCIGGKDNKENLVNLTAREHFIAHILLSKIYPNEYGLIKAINIMCIHNSENRNTNRMYGWLRTRFSKAQSLCQAGNKDSQFGTMWIYNEYLEKSKKIKKEDFVLFKEDGWKKGYVLNFESLKKRNEKKLSNTIKKEQEKLENIKKHEEYYEIYKNFGFDYFVKQTNYKYSKANLVMSFKRLLPNFVPQNGKRRSV
jgi:hypothetical protein